MRAKQYYRNLIETEFGQLNKKELKKRSELLAGKLTQARVFKDARNIMAYIPLKDEADINMIFREKKQFYIPKTVDGKIIAVEYKSNRLINLNILDLIIVPGMAFTLSGIRIGRGGGAYDKFLANLPQKIPTISAAFNFQIFDNLPREKHDMSIDKVIVEI